MMNSNITLSASAKPAVASAESRLVPFSLVAYALLVINASLYPLTGWRAPSHSPWDFLTEPWPRYIYLWDIPLNVIAYVPLGFLAVVHLLRHHSRTSSAILAILGGLVLSLFLETVQSYLPARIASNLDLACNAIGALIGAIVSCVLDQKFALRARLRAYRVRVLRQGTSADLAVTLLLIWLFVQLNPEIELLASGDLRHLVASEHWLTYGAVTYFWLETLLTAMNMLSLCVLLRLLTFSRWTWAGGVISLILGAVLLKTLAGLVLLRNPHATLWLTPGLAVGILVGILLNRLLLGQGGGTLKVAGLMGILGAVLLNSVLPINPYLMMMVQPLDHGHATTLNGATQWVAQVWPWVAALCLLCLPSPLAYPARKNSHV